MKMTKQFIFSLFLLTIITISTKAQTSTGQTGLILHSENGDYIGQGQNYSYQNCPFFRASAGRSSKGDFVTHVEISYQDVWNITFDSNKINKPLTTGVFLDAQRFPFIDPGHPGLDIEGMGRGCNELTGKFTILDAQYSTDSNGKTTVISFAATFEQHCEGSKPAFIGLIYFNTNIAIDTEKPVVSNVTFSKKKYILGKDTNVEINWKSKDNVAIASYDVFFSTDAQTYKKIASGLPANTTSYSLVIPSNTKPTTTAVVKIIAVDQIGNAGEATTDATLIIK